jgi:TrmH family RNA methyltransferase
MAQKMAVKSWDVLNAAEIYASVDEAVVGSNLVIGTTARRGVSGVLSPANIAPLVLRAAAENRRVVFLYGNEKSGLTSAELALCDIRVRVPIAADQPSLNLAQAVQIVSYELFRQALDERQTVDHSPQSQ